MESTKKISTHYYDSPVGVLKISVMDGSICQVHFEETKNESSDKKNKTADDCFTQLDEYFKGKRKIFTVKTDQEGTGFQKSVWNALEKIPFGKTISYIDVAKQLGDVKSVRAVGTANGRNNIAIIVPCHRVIGANSKLVGYSGGLWRKQWLLAHEQKIGNGVQTLF